MTQVQIRDVPEDTLTILKMRAAQAGQSLQGYLLALLQAQTRKLTVREAAARAEEIAARSSVTAEDILAEIDAMRRARNDIR
jgi:antitoxin FitA